MMKMKLIPKFPLVEPVGPHSAYHWGIWWDVVEVVDSSGAKVRVAVAEVEDDIAESLKVSGRAIPFDESTDKKTLEGDPFSPSPVVNPFAPAKEPAPEPRSGMPKAKEPAPKS